MALNVASFLKATGDLADSDPLGDLRTKRSKEQVDQARLASLRDSSALDRQKKEQGITEFANKQQTFANQQTEFVNEQDANTKKVQDEKNKQLALSKAEVFQQTGSFFTKEFTLNPKERVNSFEKFLNFEIRQQNLDHMKGSATLAEIERQGDQIRDIRAKKGTPEQAQAVAAFRDSLQAGARAADIFSNLNTSGFEEKSGTVEKTKSFKPVEGVDGNGKKVLLIPRSDGTSTTVKLGEGISLVKETPGERQQNKLDAISARAKSELNKAIAKGDGERVAEVASLAGVAAESLIELNRLENLLGIIETGGWGVEAKAFVERVTGTATGSQQEAISLFDQRAVRSLNLFAGAISDKETALVREFNPNLGTGNAGNLALVRGAIESTKRRIEKNRIVELARDGGAESMLQALINFEQTAAQNAVGGAGSTLGTAGTNIGTAKPILSESSVSASGQITDEVMKNIKGSSDDDLASLLKDLEAQGN